MNELQKEISRLTVLSIIGAVPYALVWNHLWRLLVGKPVLFSIIIAIILVVLQFGVLTCVIIRYRKAMKKYK